VQRPLPAPAVALQPHACTETQQGDCRRYRAGSRYHHPAGTGRQNYGGIAGPFSPRLPSPATTSVPGLLATPAVARFSVRGAKGRRPLDAGWPERAEFLVLPLFERKRHGATYRHRPRRSAASSMVFGRGVRTRPLPALRSAQSPRATPPMLDIWTAMGGSGRSPPGSANARDHGLAGRTGQRLRGLPMLLGRSIRGLPAANPITTRPDELRKRRSQSR
jgi:hypothetical protein